MEAVGDQLGFGPSLCSVRLLIYADICLARQQLRSSQLWLVITANNTITCHSYDF